MTGNLVDLRGITKMYGDVVANRDVALKLRPGEVHALVGENGAGKSTLSKILYGLVHPDAGEIRVRDRRIPRMTAARAIELGIGMVHQHFMLVPALSVVENIVLGREPTQMGMLDLGRAAKELQDLGTKFGIDVDPWRRVEYLSVGEAQRVEILKVLWRGAEILILDEPTAVLTPPEARELYRIVRALVSDGKTCLLITHKLDEVMAAGDRVTVMRRGQVVLEADTKRASSDEIARAMVGRTVELPQRPPPEKPPTEVVLDVRELSAGRALRGVSLQVRAGEIVGIAGVEGNGQTELVLAIADLVHHDGGTIVGPPAAHIPEDRHGRGLVLEFTVAENSILGRQHEIWGWERVGKHAQDIVSKWDVRPADPEVLTRTLSGGNQQKLVVARELGRGAKLILAAQPTRGVDLGAIELIHRKLLEARAAGAAILLVSAEISELRALADRILVFYRGQIVASLDGATATEDEIGLAMTGARAKEAAS
jgi:general nucleoside transport system ATP-binding protein